MVYESKFNNNTLSGLADNRWPDPFCDMASMAMPRTIEDALLWCQYILMAHGPYRSALQRVVSYFLTDIEIQSAGAGLGDRRIGQQERQQYLDFLHDTLGIQDVLALVAMDLLVYGNSFTSLLVPVRRYISCPQKGCALHMPLHRALHTPELRLAWDDFQFNATCPRCGRRSKWIRDDRRSADPESIRIKRWNPHHMKLLHDTYTNDTAYIWKIPADYRLHIKQGHEFQLERADWSVVQAIKNNEDLLFTKDVIHHMREEPFAGIDSKGWGMSRVLVNFRQAFYLQILQRHNEGIALDHVMPFRVITPAPRGGAGGEVSDPVLGANLGVFTSRVNRMIKAHRKDPARWNSLPTPIEYQSLGADANALAPKDLIDLGLDMLLNSVGVPVELYKGSLSTQSAPAALRLFEANWSHLVHNLNRFLRFVVDEVAKVLQWEPVTARLEKAKHADDLNRQMAMLQLMMGGQVSRTTGLKSVGADFIEEERQKLEEERQVAEATQEVQEEMEQMATMKELSAAPPPGDPAAGGGMPGGMPGGAPAGPGGQPAPAGGAPPAAAGGSPMPATDGMQLGMMGQPQGPMGAAQSFQAGQQILPNQPTTLDELQQMAQMLAAQAKGMGESQKDSFLIQLKKENEALHAIVKEELARLRRQEELAGAEMLRQQGGAQPM